MSQESLYAVSFRDPHQDGKVVTLRCRTVEDSGLGLGFVCLCDFVFSTGSLVLDPSAEALRSRFESVKRLHLHIHSVLAVEELSDESLTFDNDRSRLIVLPGPQSE